MTGVKTNNISNRANLADDVLVNREGSTALLPVNSLATQLAGSGPISDAVKAASAGIVRWANLPGMPAGSRVGQPGQVTAGSDKGEYSWTGTTWVRTGDLIDPVAIDASLAAKADQAELEAEVGERAGLLRRRPRSGHAFSDPYGFARLGIDDDGALAWRDGKITDDPRWAFAVKDRYGFVSSFVSLNGVHVDRGVLAPPTLPSLADDAKPLVPELIVRIQGWNTKLRLKQAMPVRRDADWFTASLFTPGSADGLTPSNVVEARDCIDLSTVTGATKLSIRRDGVSNVRHERALNVVVAPSAAPAGAIPQTCMLIGDSISNREIAKLIDLKLGNLGYVVDWTGTMSGAGIGEQPTSSGGELGEAREGWETGDFTNDVTDRISIVAPGGEVAYLALSKAGRANINPFLRAATESDDLALVRNGRIFDFAGYLSRFSLLTPSIVFIGTAANDIRDRRGDQLVEFYERGLTIMARQIRVSSAETYIVFWMPPPARKLDRDDWWPEYAALIRAQMRVKTILADPKIIICPTWAIASCEVDWNANSEVTDPDTGVKTRGLSDGLHPGSTVRHQIAENLSAIVAAVSAGVL